MHRNGVSKRTKVAMAVLVTCSLWVASSSVWATERDKREAHKACSNQTLSGDYGTLIDGRGNFTGRDYVVRGGNPPPPEEEWRPSSGTYIVNPDCTGSASVEVAPGNPQLGYHFIIVNGGREIFLVVDGGAIKGIARRVDDADVD